MSQEELKTLKDFIELKYNGDGQPAVIKEDLRQEAIKWIKNCDFFGAFKGQDLDEWTCGTSDRDEVVHRCHKCEWIKHFFNISEEELK